MFGFLGSLISGGLSFLGASEQREAQERQNQIQNMIAVQNRLDQQDALRNAVQIRVDDSRRAGIHPLYGLGHQASMPSTVSAPNYAEPKNLYSDFGQDMGRAVASLGTVEERSIQRAATALDLKRKGLENDILEMELASKIRTSLQPGNAPPFPSTTDPWFPMPQSDPRKAGFPDEGRLQNQKTGETGTGGFAGGSAIRPNPKWSDIEAWAEKRYGDESPITKALSVLVAGADVWENYGDPALAAARRGAIAGTEYGIARMRDIHRQLELDRRTVPRQHRFGR